MNNNKQIAILAVLAIGAYVLMSSVYTVNEVEQVIITQFGKPVGDPVTDAGLKVKVPFIQVVRNTVEAAGGSVTWSSPPTGGTTVEIEIPQV